MVTKAAVMKELEKVIDPEIGIPITKMGLIDEVKVEKGKVTIIYHFTVPFCPLAAKITSDIKNTVMKIKGVKSVELKLKQL